MDHDVIDGQLGQMYRVLVNDQRMDAEIASDLIDALQADVAADPEHAQALIWDQVDVQDIERFLFSDCIYAAWIQACAKPTVSKWDKGWLQLTFNSLAYEHGSMGAKWRKLERICEEHNLPALEKVQRWVNRPKVTVSISVAEVVYA